MAADLQVEDIAYPYVDHAQETLVTSFEFTLIEDLYGNNRRIFDGAVEESHENRRAMG